MTPAAGKSWLLVVGVVGGALFTAVACSLPTVQFTGAISLGDLVEACTAFVVAVVIAAGLKRIERAADGQEQVLGLCYDRAATALEDSETAVLSGDFFEISRTLEDVRQSHLLLVSSLGELGLPEDRCKALYWISNHRRLRDICTLTPPDGEGDSAESPVRILDGRVSYSSYRLSDIRSEIARLRRQVIAARIRASKL